MSLARWTMDASAFDWLDASAGSVIVCLSHRTIAVLLGWSYHLQFDSSWGGEHHLGLVEDIRYELMAGCDLGLIESLLQQILAKMGEGATAYGCCTLPDGAVGFVPPVPSPYTAPVPGAVVDAGWAGDGSDYDGLRGYLCAAADLIIDSMIGKIDEFQRLWAEGLIVLGAISSIMSIIWTGGLSAAIGIAVVDAVAVYEALGGVLDEYVFDDLRDRLEGLRELVRCLVMNGATAADVMEAVGLALDAAPVVAKQILLHLGWQPVLNGVYDANLVDLVGDVRDCTGSCGLGVTLDLSGTILEPVGWSTGDVVQVGQSIVVDLEPAVFGTTDGWDMFGQFWPSGASAAIRIELLGGTITTGASEDYDYHVLPAGGRVPITPADIVGGITVVATEFRIASFVAFEPPPSRPRIRLMVLGLTV